MLHGAFDLDRIRPFSSLSCISRAFSAEVLQCKRIRTGILSDTFRDASLKYYFASVDSCFRSYIYQEVGSPHDLFVMFYDNDRVSYVPETPQHRYKSLSITRMQTDTRLIKNVKRAYKRTSQSRHKIDSLALSSRQCIRCSVQSQIAKTHILNIFQTRHDLFDRLVHDLPVIICQLYGFKEFKQLRHVHAQEFMYGLSSHLHIKSLLAQTASSAFAADRLAGITAQHVLILYLVSVSLNPPEEFVQTDDRVFFRFRSISLPYEVLDLLAEIAVWFKNRDSVS